MPTTITSAGITFNDTTSLTSANIGTAQLVNGSVIASKLGTTEQKQIAKAWVNFNGTTITTVINASSVETISCNSGSTTGTWAIAGAWSSNNIGTIYKITQINGVTGGTLGGVDVSTLGIQIISVVAGVSGTFRFLSGTTTSAQSVTGTGSPSSGFSYLGTGIRSSYNVSSVTKNGTGDYTVNFATPMADVNYSPILSVGDAAALTTTYSASIKPSQTTAAFGILNQRSNGDDIDLTIFTAAVFGN